MYRIVFFLKKPITVLTAVLILFTIFNITIRNGGKLVTSGIANTLSPTPIFHPKVLAIGLNPIEGNQKLAETYFPMEGKTAEQFEDYVFNNAINSFKKLSENQIKYEIAKKINISKFPTYPNGYQFTIDNYKECVYGRIEFNPTKCESQKNTFDYPAWVRDNRICEIADEFAVDEIWVMSSPYLMTYESIMFGSSTGFSVNGPAFTVNTCKKQYILMNPTYDRGETFLHNYGHRIEATMSYLTENWKAEDKIKYWETFSSMSRYKKPDGEYSSITCGNTHFPGNGIKDYEYDNVSTKEFSCIDWKNFPDFKGEKEYFNCEKWGCNDTGWQEYWFGSIPRRNGETIIMLNSGTQVKFKNNWWFYFLYPENAIRYKLHITTCSLKGSGDADCNNGINLSDFEVFRKEFQNSLADSDNDGDGMIPFDSDFDNDYQSNISDFNLFRIGYLNSLK